MARKTKHWINRRNDKNKIIRMVFLWYFYDFYMSDCHVVIIINDGHYGFSSYSEFVYGLPYGACCGWMFSGTFFGLTRFTQWTYTVLCFVVFFQMVKNWVFFFLNNFRFSIVPILIPISYFLHIYNYQWNWSRWNFREIVKIFDFFKPIRIKYFAFNCWNI